MCARRAQVVIRHESVSRQHAAVLHAERDSYVFDLGSASGTFVDGERLQPHKTHTLVDGEAVSFGDCRATYTFKAAEEPPAGGKRKR